MTAEVMGALTLLAGLACLGLGRRAAIHLFLLSTLFGASAATILTALGSANIQPAHLLLGFLAIVAWRPQNLARAAEGLAYPRPGFWLLVTVTWGVLSAVFMPRLFEGVTYVFSLVRSSGGGLILMTPLGASTGNVTQTVYVVGNLACFCIVYALAGDRDGKRAVADAVIACGYANLGFAILDLATYATGTAELLSFMRNASYNMLDATELAGIKRIVGSFTEASAFASATLALFAVNFALWLGRYRPRLTGPVSGALVVALLLSTSTTGYLGLAAYLALVYLANLARVLVGILDPRRLAFLVYMPVALVALAAAVALHDGAARYLWDFLDQIAFAKGASQSALERGSWNSQAMINFFDSGGVGIGVGSTRGSSLVVTSLATLGVLGTATYALFILSAAAAPFREPDPEARAIRGAAASGCVAVAITACLAGTTIDLGLGFYALAATAAAPLAHRAAAPAPARARPVEPLGVVS